MDTQHSTLSQWDDVGKIVTSDYPGHVATTSVAVSLDGAVHVAFADRTDAASVTMPIAKAIHLCSLLNEAIETAKGNISLSLQSVFAPV